MKKNYIQPSVEYTLMTMTAHVMVGSPDPTLPIGAPLPGEGD